MKRAANTSTRSTQPTAASQVAVALAAFVGKAQPAQALPRPGRYQPLQASPSGDQPVQYVRNHLGSQGASRPRDLVDVTGHPAELSQVPV
jgi:hypothetical protein